MTKVSDIIGVVESRAPLSLAESWDNVGLMTGDPDDEISSVIIALDVTERLVKKAAENKALVISHHPPIFRPLTSLSGPDRAIGIIRNAIRLNVPLYAAHTNLDRTTGGVGDSLAEKLGLTLTSRLVSDRNGLVKFVTFVPPEYTERVREAAGRAGAGVIGEYSMCSFTLRGVGTFLPSSSAEPYSGVHGELSHETEDRLEMIVPYAFSGKVVEAAKNAHPYDEMAYDLIPLSNADGLTGYGVVGELPDPVAVDYFVEYVASKLGILTVTVSHTDRQTIRRVAVMGGKGRDYIRNALYSGVDAYVTGELGHHDFVDYGGGMMLVDATHRATELPVLDTLKKWISESNVGKSVEINVDYGESASTIVTIND